MSSVVKPKKLEVKTTLDIVPQKTNFVDVFDTGTTTHCFLKEGNVDNIIKVDIRINVMSPTEASRNLSPPPKLSSLTFLKKHATPTFSRPWHVDTGQGTADLDLQTEAEERQCLV